MLIKENELKLRTTKKNLRSSHDTVFNRSDYTANKLHRDQSLALKLKILNDQNLGFLEIINWHEEITIISSK